MIMACKSCGGLELIEKEHPSIHKKGVYCAYCGAFIKFGSIEIKEKVPDGEHLANVKLAEEKDKTDGGKYIFLILEVKGYKNIVHIIKKLESKYDPKKITELLKGFNKQAVPFKEVQDLLSFILGKQTLINVDNGWIKGWRAVRKWT